MTELLANPERSTYARPHVIMPIARYVADTATGIEKTACAVATNFSPGSA